MNEFLRNRMIDAFKNGRNVALENLRTAEWFASDHYSGVEDNDAFTAYLAGYLGEMRRIVAEQRSSAIWAEHKSNVAKLGGARRGSSSTVTSEMVSSVAPSIRQLLPHRIVEKIRAMLRRKETVPPDDIEELCDETQALQDVLDRISRTGDYTPKPEQE